MKHTSITARMSLVFVIFLLLVTSCSVLSPNTQPDSPAIDTSDDQISITNANGVVVFRDPVTEENVNISVIDTHDKPLEGMTVLYKHGSLHQYEAFFVFDDEGQLVGGDFYLHNSGHVIRVEPNVMHRANPDQVRAITGYADETGFGKDAYQRTITNSEYKEIGKRRKALLHIVIHGIALYFGYHVPPTAELVYESETEFYNGQWDEYVTNVYSKEQHIGQENLYQVQSQAPVMQFIRVRDVNGTAHINMLAIDPIEYPTEPHFKIDSLDHTIFLGPTQFSDLVYHYRLQDNTGTTIINWTEISENAVCVESDCQQTETIISNLAEGDYIVEIYATDEVDNKSETLRQSFTISKTDDEIESSLPQTESIPQCPVPYPPDKASRNTVHLLIDMERSYHEITELNLSFDTSIGTQVKYNFVNGYYVQVIEVIDKGREAPPIEKGDTIFLLTKAEAEIEGSNELLEIRKFDYEYIPPDKLDEYGGYIAEVHGFLSDYTIEGFNILYATGASYNHFFIQYPCYLNGMYWSPNGTEPDATKTPTRVPEGTYLGNSQYGYELYYPDAFSEIGSPFVPLMIVDPLEGLELVDQRYLSGTNLKQVQVGIGATSNSSIVSSCLDYGEDEIISSIPYKKVESSEAGGGSIYWQINYRTLQKGTCYEIGFVISYGNMDMYASGSVVEFDKNALLQEINQLMSTFSIAE